MKAVLFDLDGTLLPLDVEGFPRVYLGALAARLAKRGYDPKAFVDGIWKGTAAMMKNDGAATNEEVFWNVFAGIFGEKIREEEEEFEAFYREEFDSFRAVCGFLPEAAKTVAAVREMGVTVALATNPIFPAIATEKRIAWAGLNKADFACVTTYENSRYSKPNPAYYLDVAKRIGIPPEECVMVGNDAVEDLAAREAGMDVFLLVGGLLNRKGVDISAVPQGGFGDLLSYLKAKLDD